MLRRTCLLIDGTGPSENNIKEWAYVGGRYESLSRDLGNSNAAQDYKYLGSLFRLPDVFDVVRDPARITVIQLRRDNSFSDPFHGIRSKICCAEQHQRVGLRGRKIRIIEQRFRELQRGARL
jgi:hypothetical protein